MLERLKTHLQKYDVAWYGCRASDCWGLSPWIPFHTILCCDYGQDTSSLAASLDATLVSLEEQGQVRGRWDNFALSKLFLSDRVDDWIKAQFNPIYLLAYSTNERLERFAVAHPERIRLLGIPAALKHRLDDKVYFRNTLPTLGIKPVPGEVRLLQEVSFNVARQKYGAPVVVQLPFSSTGKGTFFVAEEETWHRLQNDYTDQRVIISRYVESVPVNIHGAIVDDQIVLAAPSAQVIGVPECTGKEGIYAGCDFGAVSAVSDLAWTLLFQQAKTIGAWMRDLGYRGMFGLDFLATDNTAFPLEVNPRFQGSTDILTQLENEQGDVPLALLHLLEFLGDSDAELASLKRQLVAEKMARYQQDGLVLLHGSLLFLYQKEKHDSAVQGHLRPGIYRLRDGQLHYQHEGFSTAACTDDNQFVIKCGVPDLGKRIKAGALMLQVQTQRSVMDARTGQLTPWAATICQEVYRTLALTPEPVPVRK